MLEAVLESQPERGLCSCVICSMACNHSTSGKWQGYRLVQTSDYQAIIKALCLRGIMTEKMAPSWCGVAYQMSEKMKEGWLLIHITS